MITETAIEFASEGALLRGRLVMPALDVARRPAVIMAHGTSATVEMVMIEYARVFARAGLVALVYDHRNLGRSGGEPRGEINPWVQCRGYLAALDFASQRAEIDPGRIALWGDSHTGGQVVAVAGTLAVSYTHLDVYKRQVNTWSTDGASWSSSAASAPLTR